MTIVVCGVLNCTPDSFSDGGSSIDPDVLIEKGRRLVRAGADMIDIGGDSTRPGSKCVGPEEEWRRIGPVVRALVQETTVSIDTHHVEVAKLAIESGAQYINDIGGGRDTAMISTIADSNASYIVMFSATGVPHQFNSVAVPPTPVEAVANWFAETIERLGAAGIGLNRIVLDSGMGAFVGADPSTSWALLKEYPNFARYGCALMLACSRKRFLEQPGESRIEERDEASALCGTLVAQRLNGAVPLLLRVHNVTVQRKFLTIWENLRE